MNPPTFRAAIAAIHMFVLPASAAVVDATYNSQSDVPVTAVGYTAAGNTVDFTLNFAPAVATCLMVVKNTGTDFIQGAFDNLAQGQTVNLTYGDVSYPFVANYHGGSGNDLVLEWANNRLLAWGYNNSGQLGNNSTTNSGIAVPVDMSGVLAGKTVVRTAAGLYSVALCSDGSLAAWGYNYNHELGNESSANSSVPLRVNLSGSLARKTVVDIAVGLSHTLALCADGSVIAWGSNSSGQLGCGAAGGTTTTWSLPVLVDMTGVLAGKTVVAVAAGSYHNLALCADGTLTTWGSNGYGQLGNNSTTSTSTPVLVNRAGVLAGKTITAIAAGGNHSLALCSDGTLATWGYNNSGQLGNNSTSNSSAPVLVVISGELSGKTLTGIAAGNSHSLALCTDGSMAAWGYNASGQLGNGITGTNSYVPVLVNQTGVLAGKSVNAIGAGYEHNLAQCNDGSLVSWGTNGLGTLGNNSTSSSSVPVAVTTTMLRTGERLLRAGSGNNSWHNLAVVAMPPLPAGTTVAATAVTDTGATLNASVNAQGTTTTVSFEYGPTNSYGSTLAATPTTATGTTATAARATLGGLPSGSTWHYRVVATSMFGTTKGADMSFTTPAEARLTGLLVSAGTLYPAFASINTHYVLAVPYVTDNIAFTPSCPNPNAVVTVNGVTVASGIASDPVSLTVGNTVINTVVTAADSNTQAYIITVTRLPQTITYNSAATTPVTVGDFVASGNAPNIILNYAPSVGSTLSVVKNTGLNPIQGTFSNLTQGQVVNLTFGGVSYPFVANYYGGTGNDLVLQWGNNRLLAWGYNYYGQLGNNTSDSSNIPTAVDVSGVLAGKSIISISTGRSHALALCADGSVASWGSNSNDQLGISRTSYHYAPGWVDRSGVLASKTVIAIAAGNYHNLALCSDGTLASWGDNTSGQLGNDTNTSSGVPVLVDRTGVLSGKTIIAIAAGFLDSFALCSDGTLAGWGNNNNGCLGNNTNNYSCAPVRVCQGGALAGKTILADCTIGSSNLALTADGILATWGSNSNGELGNKTTISSGVPVPVDKSGVLAGKTISQIIPGGAHFLVLCSDGKVVSWGLNNCGQLGNNTTTNSSVPVAVLQTGVLSGKTVTAISAGNNQSYALCSDNSLAAWGYNSSGELGNNSTTNSSVPVTVNRSALAAGEIISAVTGGDGFSLALVASPPAPVSTSLAATEISDTAATLRGTVNANGTNTNISFEYGLTTSYGTNIAATPATASGSTATAASVALSTLRSGTTWHYRIVASSAGGTVKGADMTFTTSTQATLSNLTLGNGTLAPVFSNNTTSYVSTVPFTTTTVDITPLVANTGATVTVAGVAVVSGSTSTPISLAVGNTRIDVMVTASGGGITQTYSVTVTRLPQTLAFNSATDVPVTAGGFAATGNVPPVVLNYAPAPGGSLMLVKNTGLGLIAGTFANLEQGQLVSLTYGGITYPFVANYFGGTGNDLVLQWANTRLMDWGDNNYGQLGNNSTSYSSVAVPVNAGGVLAGKTVIASAAGSYHNLALCADGTLSTWGYNNYGQLGNNSTTDAMIPVTVDLTGVLAGKTVVAISAGGSHNLALCSDGSLAAWGYNNSGQLGNGSTANAMVPVAVDQTGVLAGRTVVAVSAGSSHSLALCSDGTLATWGSNAYGLLGNNTLPSSSVPVRVEQSGVLAGKTVVAIAAGGSHNIVLCANGSLATWGYNSSGQLGNNTTTNLSRVPVLVTQTAILVGRTVTAIAAGDDHSIVLCADGIMAVWGNNTYGNFGNNGTTNSKVPVTVIQTGVLAGKTVATIDAGSHHNLALCADGNLAAWGSNSYGQLGNNSSSQSNVPIWVSTSSLRTGERFMTPVGGSQFSLAMVAMPPVPAVVTQAATGVNDTAATLNGSVNAQGGSTTVTMEYGPTSSYGNTVPPAPATVSGASPVTASVTLNDLPVGSTWHYRVVASGSSASAAGDDMTFTTSTHATLSNLTLDSGTLTPAFTSALRSYCVTVPNSVTAITVTPVAADAGSMLKVNGVSVTSGSSSEPIILSDGETVISIVVAAPDGINTLTYTVKVVRLPQAFTYNSSADVPLSVSDFVVTGNAPSLALNDVPVPGTTLMVVRNTDSRPIQGTFDNLAQGQLVSLTYGGLSYGFVANYHGGSGNDLVLQWANTRLLAWGNNGNGQLGSNYYINSSVPASVDMSGTLAGKTLISVALGGSFNLAPCADGTLVAWGNSNYGQLGNNSISSGTIIIAKVDQTGVLAGKTVVASAAGANHSLALCADGTLASWGNNAYGQLGNNNTINSSIPVLVTQSGVLAGRTVVAIAAGNNHNLALCADGTLAAWGQNTYGALGNNTNTNSGVPVQVVCSGVLAGKTITAIAAGSGFSLALCADGTLAAWGVNNYGQLGNSTATNSMVPVAANLTGVLAGKIVTAVSCGTSHSLALCADGTVVAWGYNNYGQLGNKSSTNSSVPVAVYLTGALSGKTVSAISAGGSHNLALCTDNSLAAWGYDNYGQLGNNSTTNSNEPVLVNNGALLTGERIIAAGAGSDCSLAMVAMPLPPVASTLAAQGISDSSILLNGSVNGCGTNADISFDFGLTPAYGTTLTGSPASITGTTTTAVNATASGLLANTTYHYRVVATGSGGKVPGDDMTFTTSSTAALANLTLSSGTLAPAFTRANPAYAACVSYATDSVTVTPVAADPAATIKVNGVTVASGSACAPLSVVPGDNTISIGVTAAGGGYDNTYTLKIVRMPQSITFNSATDVPLTVSELAATGSTLPAVILNHAPPPGTILTIVRNTGSNPIAGAFDNLASGQRVQLTFGGVTYQFVADYFGGTGNDLVLRWADTRLLAWGDNSYGQLGNSSTVSYSYLPVAVDMTGALAGKTVVASASGFHYVLALCSDGTLAAWGDNSSGQLGTGNRTASSVPVSVRMDGVLAGRRVIAIAASGGHSLALCADGTMAEWGSYYYGSRTDIDQTVPAWVDQSGILYGRRVMAIAVGDNHSLALCSDGSMASWGANRYGQLGNSLLNSAVPESVNQAGVLAGKTVTGIAAGAWHNLALCSDGTLIAWGYNNNGQLGNNNTTNSSVPVTVIQSGVLAGKTITAIAGGGYHSLALCADGTLAVWGSNYYGQLGNNTNTNSSVPVAVTQSGRLSGRTITSISGGGYHSLAMCQDGTIATWGSDSYGQLGASGGTSSVPIAAALAALQNGERYVTAGAGSIQCYAVVAMPQAPVVTTLAAAAILDTGATLRGSVNANGMERAISFEYGPTSSYGSTVAATPASASGASTTLASADLSGLLSGSTYHYRILATTGITVTRGEDMTFTTGINETLTNILLDSGALSPAFTGAGSSYVVTVPYATANMVVTPVAANAAATITVNGSVVPSGTAAGPTHLSLGENTITIALGAAGGTADTTYQIKVTRLPVSLTCGSAAADTLTVGGFQAAGTTPALVLTAAPVPGTCWTIIRNTGGSPIQGTFSDLAQGQVVYLPYGTATYAFVANYRGGTGNDLVLQWANTRLLSWGYDNYGQLGDNSTNNRNYPIPVDVTGVLAGKTIIATAGGGAHSLALCADGTLAAWGYNNYGQLGNNSTTNSGVPVLVNQTGVLAGKTVIAIAAGSSHSLACCADGTLAAWGDNSSNQLGNISTGTSSSVPVLVNQTGVLAGKSVIAMAAGSAHNLVLCADGTLAAWGYNSSGQLGNNSSTNSSAPVRVNQTGVLAGKSIAAIAAGSSHNLVLCGDGTVAAWGSNFSGQFGNNRTADSSAPVWIDQTGMLANKTVTAISAGDMFSLALCADGTLASWGYNVYNSLGNNSTYNGYAPAAVFQADVLANKTVIAISAVGAGSSHVLALCADGSMATWGYNAYGQLGNFGTTSNSSVPVPVATHLNGYPPGMRFMTMSAGENHNLALAAMPLPAATAQAATAITGTGATIRGSVNANGSDTAVSFEYGPTPSYGFALTGSPSSVSGIGNVMVGTTISGLMPGGTCHFRVVASNSSGVVRSADMAFTTPSNNALLAALALNAASLTPTFNKTTTEYLTTVTLATSAVAVTPVCDHSEATVKVNGTPVTSGTPSGLINLAMGANTITTVVTAEDGITTQSYVIVIYRRPAADDDSDHDGIPYLIEYAFGLDPTSNNQGQLPQLRKVAKRWEIRFTEPAGVGGITYGAQWSSALQPGSWTDIPDSGTGIEHVFSVPEDTASNLFMRLKVTQP